MSSAEPARSSAMPSSSCCMPSVRIEASPAMSPAPFLLRPSSLSQNPMVSAPSSVGESSIGVGTLKAGLAKKSKTPPPPRRPVQAPRRRAEHRAKSEDRRTRLYAGIFAASGVLLVGGAFALVAFGGGGSSDVVGASGLIKTKSCTETSYPGLTAAHINNPDQKVKYNSFPPSSGPHYQQPSPWGLYDQPIQETILVHNLEHGGSILQYGHRVAPNP